MVNIYDGKLKLAKADKYLSFEERDYHIVLPMAE